MRRALILCAVVAAALAAAGSAAAGCFATVGTALPKGVAAGQTWVVDLEVLQHGRTPLAGATPTVLISNAQTGERKSFPAAPTGQTGVYRAEVVFPSAGAWVYSVNDGFPGGECAQTHSFGTMQIGGTASVSPPSAPGPTATAASDGFPVWPVVGGLLAAGVAAGLALVVTRRLRPAPGPTPSAR